jgi:hypothetical protein
MQRLRRAMTVPLWSECGGICGRFRQPSPDTMGHAHVPCGRLRHVPLTRRLAAAPGEHRHLRSARVLCQDGTAPKSGAVPLTRQIVQSRAKRAARKAGLLNGGVHILRHTFCSHLAMRGAPARAIQELAGHMDLSMTQRYMHLSQAALDSAIRLLEQHGPAEAGRDVPAGSAKAGHDVARRADATDGEKDFGNMVATGRRE